jgi:outer membrane protein OmpA-like peptidoglycan-associated protein
MQYAFMFLFFCGATTVSLAQKLGNNLVENGDFEKKNTGFQSAFRYTTCKEERNECGNGRFICGGTYTVARSANPCNPDWGTRVKDHTSQTGNMLIADFYKDKTAALWTQLIKVKPKSTYIFSVWLTNISPNSVPAAIQLVAGTQVSSVKTVGADIGWSIFSMVLQTGAQTELRFSVNTANQGLIGYDLALDDIVLMEIIPETTPKIATEKTPLPPLKNLSKKEPPLKIPVRKEDLKPVAKPLKKQEILAITDTTTKIVTRSIAWDRGKATLQSESLLSLNTLFTQLKQQPKCKLRVVSHTDTRGSADLNMALSLSRSQAVVAYLIKKGIDSDRLSYQGMGETMPLVVCETDDSCTEAQHALNRRTEFVVNW